MLQLARIYELFPLCCPKSGAELRIIAFITVDALSASCSRHEIGAILNNAGFSPENWLPTCRERSCSWQEPGL
jgi:hypothetical protein